MIRNLLLVALRNLKRDFSYSLLNILGLTIGITFSLLLVFYVMDELSYDRYNKNVDRIVRINAFIKEEGKDTMRWASTQVPLAPELRKDFPEVEQAVRFIGSGAPTVFRRGESLFHEEKVYYADSNVFKVFTYPFIVGDPRTALVDPNSMVMNRSLAKKYFGNPEAALGQSLRAADGKLYKVTGVTEDVPPNSHLRYHILISETSLPKDFDPGWGSFFLYTYVLLKPHTDPLAFEKKLGPLYAQFMAPIFAQYKVTIRYGVQPIAGIHLHSDTGGEPEDTGSMSYIWIFSAVALFMLLIACINYMNLTTARSARRAKEIGIRKVTGSTRRQLVAQFLVESMLSALVALILSIGLVLLLLPVFNNLAGKEIGYGILLRPEVFGVLLAIVVFVGLSGGSYPAFYLSRFNPVSVLKGSLSKGSSNVTLRRALILIQFSISMTMLICTLVVYRQLQYLRSVDLGFNKDQVVSLPVNTDKDMRSQILAFQNEMRKNPGVLSVSTSDAVPGEGISFNLFSIQTDSGYTQKGVFVYRIDENYLKTLGMHIVQGRDFSGLPDTLHGAIVNENMVKYYGWKTALGKLIKFPGDTSGRYLEVVGVVHDFNQASLYDKITPLILLYAPNNGEIELKLDAGKIPATMASVGNTWKATFPDLPFDYKFLDQQFDSQYAADQRRGKIFTSFSTLTVVITCLGLLGLIAFVTEQRRKEISIRKIMGAGLLQIIPLITRNFVFLVGLACLIAFPVAWWFMHEWLAKFSYSISVWNPTPFLVSALVVLGITLLTVMYHTVRAAMTSPVKSLRTE